MGWQRQPNGLSVQQCLEEAMEKVLRSPVELVGCGRTDAGVHASRYYAHFDWPNSEIHNQTPDRLNRLLPPEIAIESIYPVAEDCHARYSATRRTYHYYLTGHRDPFRQDLVYNFYNFKKLDRLKMHEMAMLIRQYDAFFPFCKTHSGVEHYHCKLIEANWTESEDTLIFEIKANRFLRGMVRLIVGMSLQVGLGKVNLGTIQDALTEQKPLQKSLSAPAHGLFLSNVEYPD